MRLTSEGKFSEQAPLDLSLNQSSRPLILGYNLERQGISQSFLVLIFKNLKKKGVGLGIMGPKRRCTLSKNIKKSRILGLIEAIDQKFQITKCNSIDFGCSKKYSVKCLAHNLWGEIIDYLYSHIYSISLDDVINNNLRLENNVIKFN